MTEPSYTPTGWIDGAAPPIDAANLTHLETGLQTATSRAAASVRYDAAQTLTGTQQAQAQRNMGLPVFVVAAPTGVAATDLANINAAITAAGTTGGVIQLQSGVYVISGTVTLSNYTEIRGQGPFATILRTSSTTADIITCAANATLIGVRDLQLDSVVARTAGAGVNFANCTGYVIDNVRFVDTYNLGTFTNADSGWLSRIKVAHGSGVINRGFWWQSCIDTHLSQILINGGTVTLGTGLAWLQVDSGCDTWSMVDGGADASSGSGIGLYLSHSLSPSSFPPRWVKVSNFWFEGSHGGVSGANGVQIDNCHTVYFSNGYVATSNYGVYIAGGQDIKLSQCVLLNNWERGALASGTTGPFDVHFEDCTFDSNSQGANNNVGHLYVGGNAQFIRVRDSVFSNDILGATNLPNYAIENSIPASSDIRVSGCRFKASAYGTGIIGGTQGLAGMIARDNQGLNPITVTTPAVPASGTAQTNSTGTDCAVYIAGGTVSAVAVHGVTTGLTSGTFRVPAGQTIILTYTAAPTWAWVGD